MNVLFHSNQLSIRGTEVALYDYAHYNEILLGHISYIAAPANSNLEAIDKFLSRFGSDRVILYEDFNTFSNSAVQKYNVEACYFIKSGINDGKLIPGIKNIVHAVFNGIDPHGDVYVAVSEWLGEKYKIDYLPHIVSLPDVNESYRSYLGFSENDLVFGRYGGYDQFDVPYIGEVIHAAANVGIKFVLMNTKIVTPSHQNIIYLNGVSDLESKTAYINTCDAMLHARTEGETFGLAICEFLHRNKPVITNIECRDRNHITILKDKGYYYTTAQELYSILVNFQKKDYNVSDLVKKFNPEVVMKKFNQYMV